MNYLLLILIGIISTIFYGVVLKKKPKKKIRYGFLGLGISGDFGGDDEETITQTQEQKQEYQYAPETLGARKSWWERLQEWGKQPGYGAIAPDWEDIWGRAKRRVGQYYWGSDLQPGLAGKVRASAARRGVSESPAMEEMMGRMGRGEAGQLQDIAVEQALQKALFGERGRQNWLSSLTRLAGLGPIGQTGTTTITQPEEEFDWFTPLMSTIGTVLGGEKIGGLIKDYFQQGRASSMQPSITSYGGGSYGATTPYYLSPEWGG